MKIWTILVAAGEGLRFGSRKQLAELAGMPVLVHSTINASSVSDGIVVVTSEEDIEFVICLLRENPQLMNDELSDGTTCKDKLIELNEYKYVLPKIN